MSARLPLVVLGLVGALSVAGCSSDSRTPAGSCPGPRPAFSLVVRTLDGTPLPPETKVTVSSGSGVEVYDAQKPPASPQIVFCDHADLVDGGAAEAGAGDGGDAGASLDGGIGALSCRLWTDGAADVTVESRGFVTTKTTLRAVSDACGIVTTDATVTVVRIMLDGGP